MDQTEVIKRRYNRNAALYGLVDRIISHSLRREVLAGVGGKILEVGVGTGLNLPLYPPGSDVTGIDFSPLMLKRAVALASEKGLKVRLMEMDAQNMDFPDHSFDTVVATCVFCTVPDPVRGLKEIKRVLRPGGRAVLLEHVRSERPVLGRIMDILNPLTLALIGDNINRDTVAGVKKAGLMITGVTDIKGDILKIIRATA
ncbi:MAG: methyltransferase type 11 [Peptococcaceae bacterium BICA1-7]|nr:MAG: methyltransferase type 11 [Peptococcaceae bacterium BICA1-7]HBV98563.1 class I SAM-dependent methyltransferase [Desulfotomaculum sp.]